jgi:putative toxin-antitoxin system antitoxin component (TIGR02293 family)
MAALRTSSIVTALGGRKVLKAGLASAKALVRGIDQGLPYASLESLAGRFGFTRGEIASALRIPMRTIARRKRERRLSRDESDRVVRLARVAANAERILGDPKKAGGWLRDPNIALGGDAPIELLWNDLGAAEVETILGRIEFGVFS